MTPSKVLRTSIIVETGKSFPPFSIWAMPKITSVFFGEDLPKSPNVSQSYSGRGRACCTPVAEPGADIWCHVTTSRRLAAFQCVTFWIGVCQVAVQSTTLQKNCDSRRKDRQALFAISALCIKIIFCFSETLRYILPSILEIANFSASVTARK